MPLGSLFDGIGGWLLAARHAGVTPIWASEIEPFPCSVTARHFPGVTQMGDITKIDGAAIPPVDIICAGSPCQDLSIAGRREGLDGARSGLFRRAVDIVRAMPRHSERRAAALAAAVRIWRCRIPSCAASRRRSANACRACPTATQRAAVIRHATKCSATAWRSRAQIM